MHPETRDHPTDLLPWWVNGTLAGEEYQQVSDHLAACGHCQEEVAFLQTVRDQLRARPLPDAGELGLQRLLREVRKPVIARRKQYRPWAIAAALVIAVQAALLTLYWPGATDTTLQPLSAGTPAQAQVVLQVEFRPEATHRQISATLRAVQGRIIDGPGALGIYRIALPPGADVEQAIRQLRAAENVIRHVARD